MVLLCPVLLIAKRKSWQRDKFEWTMLSTFASHNGDGGRVRQQLPHHDAQREDVHLLVVEGATQHLQSEPIQARDLQVFECWSVRLKVCTAPLHASSQNWQPHQPSVPERADIHFCLEGTLTPEADVIQTSQGRTERCSKEDIMGTETEDRGPVGVLTSGQGSTSGAM
jgi:hypothetical protein